jgi:ribosomal protein L35
MLDKFLTGENVKVNGEIAGRRHILRTLEVQVKIAGRRHILRTLEVQVNHFLKY